SDDHHSGRIGKSEIERIIGPSPTQISDPNSSNGALNGESSGLARTCCGVSFANVRRTALVTNAKRERTWASPRRRLFLALAALRNKLRVDHLRSRLRAVSRICVARTGGL